MDLRVYLATVDMSVKDFSEKIDCNRCYLSRVIRHHVIPSKRLAKDIEFATEGKVTVNELLKIIEKTEKPQFEQL